ncbi:MAG: hypothetical protein M3Q06_12575 [Bacteroidota bacterium]|nr:hypothetical protein [Bacteroidota bacterium]
MDETFALPVTYRGEELLFPARLEQVGYTHRFVVDVKGAEVIFEPDEERNYRAIMEEEGFSKEVTVELLKAIASAIEEVLR